VFLTQNEPEGGSSLACWGLNISVEHTEELSLEQIRAFLEASAPERFSLIASWHVLVLGPCRIATSDETSNAD
jgi:hypothetical protein